MLRALRSAALTAIVLVAIGCASPTLPLPPPVAPSIAQSPTDPTMVHLISNRGAEPGAIIVVLNLNPNVPPDKRVSGSQADGNGSWECDSLASRGDVLEITQEFGSARSTPTDVQVP